MATITLSGPRLQKRPCSRGLWTHIKLLPPKTVTAEDGTITIVEKSEEEKSSWFQEDQLVLSLIHSSLEASVLSTYIHKDTPKDLWDTLEGIYGNLSNSSRIYEFKKSLHTITQRGQPFNKLLGELSALWAELDELRPVSTDSKIIAQRNEQDKVYTLLLSLDGTYGDLIHHVLRQTELPSLNEVCMNIKREEGGRNLFQGTTELAHFRKFQPSSRDKKTPFCEHCKKSEHFKDKCWILHPHLRPQKFRDQGPSSRHSALTTSTTELFSEAEYKTLKQLIQSATESGIVSSTQPSPSSSVIIDSGATNHMFYDVNMFDKLEKRYGTVSVANGINSTIQGQGIVRLFEKDINALYVLDFKINLLSIPKLTSDLDCKAIFDANEVLFEDTKTGAVFGK
ncbi:PREDICTED: uncharacterized protein LOC104809686 [Tarenaya hassleriana]|uniref:uncharacterized protein LOC104809686 n=1 Tax=Tarenaya hassleriana TaxID=28532 RepID=UPI00053C24AD|nr:PREDICTED: uncharacterized protein LOC104809686 [Tarenaya hassleriana]